MEVGSRGQAGEHQAAHEVRSRFFAPPEQFNGCFTTFYHLELTVEDGQRINDHLQPEWGNIRFFTGSVPDASIGNSEVLRARFGATGPSSKPLYFELGSCRMWGIGFLPLGWARFIDTDARELSNQVFDGSVHPAFSKFTDLAAILCDRQVSDQEQFEAIVEHMGRLMRPHRDEEAILRVHRLMVDEDLSNVGEFADRAGMSIRTLERICIRHFGFTPKLLMRRQRFMRSLTAFMLHQDSKWTDVIDGHYHDQAQFTREFRAFMGMSPSEYAAQEHPILTAFVEARARIWGSPAQTLDRPS